MKHLRDGKLDWEKTYQQWAPGRITNRDLEQVEVELVQLSKGVDICIDMLRETQGRLAHLVLQLQEQE